MIEAKNPYDIMAKALSRMRELSKETFIITADLLGSIAREGVLREEGVKAPVKVLAERPVKMPLIRARDIEPDIRVLEDAGREIALSDFLGYFKSRFEGLWKIFQQRPDTRDALPVVRATSTPDEEVRMIGMVRERRSKDGRAFLVFEDLEGSVPVLLPIELAASAQRVFLDQVLCITVRRWRRMFIAREIVWPDIPDIEPNRADVPVYAVLTSDFHIGSKMFAEKAFGRFIRWLRGEYGDAALREVAQAVKYLIINGDLVDGVKVHSREREEFVYKSIQDQYGRVAEYIKRIPDHITVVVSPGDHDATNTALPHMPISRDHADALYECRDLIMVGNPALISLHGVKVLLYHGEGLDDVIATVPGFSYENVAEAMRLLLQCRHLAPIYGKGTGILPLPRDPLVIRERPDVFHTGHVHVFSQAQHNRAIMINSGCWQFETPYQRQKGLTPTAGIVPVLNLQTLSSITLDFTREPYF